ncbi:liprin-beta-2 isoform X2 [Aethina tumida]|uniref:liprin-beta-2 isoform X2 n=1 Tax=Aethina tumida TaxID=116153 RepID=UPI002147EAF0|nr:liprin-beta-2 isoform X2 [Aethina tumida]
MPEMKSGAVVAAVVAALEKQKEQHQFRYGGTKDQHVGTRFGVELKNRRRHANADENFRTAVKHFDFVAEDVQNLLLKGRNGEGLMSERGDSSSEYSEGSESDSDVEREHVIADGLDTIAEEDRRTNSSASYAGLEENESSLEEDSTLKDQNGWSHSSNNGSTSDISTTSSERPISLKDSSTRCNSDFQWIRRQTTSPKAMEDSDLPLTLKLEERETTVPASKPPISRSLRDRTPKRDKVPKTPPGSLDRRRTHQQSRQERDQKSRSTHAMKSPPRLDDYTSGSSVYSNSVCQNYCCVPQEGHCFENFHRRHERLDPQRYGSSPMLLDQQHHRSYSDRGSHPDIYGDCNRFRHEPVGCCGGYHMMPPCCFYGDRGYHWMQPPYPKPGEQDEKLRKIQHERDNLVLQVQVLTEQVEAQTDKISDLEKMLQEKKYHLSEAEENLQREVLSRSSLETQKLELLSKMSEMKLQKAALERENLELRNSQYASQEMKKPPVMPRMSPQPQLTSTPVQTSNQNLRMSPSPSPVSLTGNSPRRDSQDGQPLKTQAYKRQIDVQYGSLPRQQFLSNGSTNSMNIETNANGTVNGVAARGRGVAFAEAEKIMIDDGSTEPPGSPNIFNQKKGLKKIFGRMKRSGSGNLEDLPGINEFQRGGVRATAGGRLGWSEPQIVPKPDKPFSKWDTENVCDWLQDLGLDQYITEAKRFVKSGQQLQETSINEIEKELNIKNPLHRKKLQLALIDTDINSSSDPYLTMAGKLDTAWVLRWLDDTGLPQHKENFLINRVDGRVLHRLTIDDLALLHVTSLLHVASIKRGIQVLRENNYEPGCLQRRSLPDDPEQPTPKDISLWTTHRVMEWLKAVDLAEYAPNLRGAGVHGGLMVYETKFTAELLASLLSIPPGKTLLRRHLNTHFKELLGKDVIQEKREAEGTMGYIPLTPSSKLKVSKKSQFSLKRKKSKGEADYGDLVCPLNPDKSGDLNGSTLNSSIGMTRIIAQEDEDVFRRDEAKAARSLPASIGNSPVPQRHV